MIASRSPSRVIVGAGGRLDGPHGYAPKLLMADGFVGVDLEEVLRPGHRQHRFHALLDAGELERAAGGGGLAVQIHQAADGGAVDVGDGGQVEQHLALAAADERRDGVGELRQERIHQARLVDADDGDALIAVGGQVHPDTPVFGTASCCSRSCWIWRASSVRPRLMRDFTVPSGRSQPVGDLLVGQLLDVAQHHRGAQRRRQPVERRRAAGARGRAARARLSALRPGATGVRSAGSTSRLIVSRSLRTLR